ncbi:MAG: 3-deoxy-D-manno-octulosonic acid transferase [Inhella sp.]
MRERLALALWGWAMRLATPALLARWWWRGRQEPGYRHAMVERLGFYACAPQAGCLWLHAVSLGETRAAAPLLAALRAQDPGLRLLLTHTTATGREAGLELLREGDAQTWLPLDTPGAVRRFLRHWRPQAGVLMETEVWPSLQAAALAEGVPMVLATARLSERSLRRGERLRGLLRPAAQRLTLALAQTDDDAARLRLMGVPHVQTVGHLKFDIRPDAGLLARGRVWRAGLRRPVLLLAVSREGEEAALLDALAPWQGRPLPAHVLVVPRHPQRFDEVARLLSASGRSLSRRSTWGEGPDAGAELWLGDSLREMPLYYGLADVALLGGSFEPLGGQNLIEAAACGCPLLMGPHTFNFTQAAEMAEAAGAARRVGSMSEAIQAASGLLHNEKARVAMANAGFGFAEQHRGAAERMAAAVMATITRRCGTPA